MDFKEGSNLDQESNFRKLTESIEELVAKRSPIDSQVWKWAWLGSIGCSDRRRFRFRWQSRKTDIMTRRAMPRPRPISMNSFTSVSLMPGRKRIRRVIFSLGRSMYFKSSKMRHLFYYLILLLQLCYNPNTPREWLLFDLNYPHSLWCLGRKRIQWVIFSLGRSVYFKSSKMRHLFYYLVLSLKFCYNLNTACEWLLFEFNYPHSLWCLDGKRIRRVIFSPGRSVYFKTQRWDICSTISYCYYTIVIISILPVNGSYLS